MKKHTVWIVDDDQDIIEVLSANNGFSALEVVKEKPVDIILLDVMMPEMNGLLFIKELRTFNDLPVLFLTAKTESTDKILGLQLGADTDSHVLSFSNLKLDLHECVLFKDNDRLEKIY